MGRQKLCNVPLWTGSKSTCSDPSGYSRLPRGHGGDHTICLQTSDEYGTLDIDLTAPHNPYDLWKPEQDLPHSQDDVW